MNQKSNKLESKNHKWLIGSITIYMILVFNFLEPFEINIEHGKWPYHILIPYHLVLTSFGIIAGLTVFVALKWLQPIFFKHFSPDNSKTMFVWFFLLVVLVSVVNWLYIVLLHHTISGWNHMYVPERRFFQMTAKFLSIYSIWGLFFWINWLMIKRSQKVIPTMESIALFSENQSDRFRVDPAKLICLKTCDNYLEVYYLDEQDKLQNRMIRSSLKKAEEQLNQPQFIRSHQSFLVNKNYLKGLKKSANGHQLEVAYIDFDVHVTKKNIKTIKSILTESP